MQLLYEFFNTCKLLSVEHFYLQSHKETFHRSVIHTVAFARHALHNVVLFQVSLVFCVLVLPALVRVKYRRCPLGESFTQPVQLFPYLCKIWTERYRVRLYLIVVQVHYWREIYICISDFKLRNFRCKFFKDFSHFAFIRMAAVCFLRNISGGLFRLHKLE